MQKACLFVVMWCCLIPVAAAGQPAARGETQKIRLAVIGLDHDHVWGILKTIADEPGAELVAIADPHPELVEKARGRVPGSVQFYSDYVKMLDEAKPEAVIVTTENDRHLEILRECAKRHIHLSTEKPLAATANQAREMDRLAREAGIILMVNYWNAWTASTHEGYARVKAGEIGPLWRIVAQWGHRGPKEIGVSKFFGEWLYDPKKNGAGALMDFGCYGAAWAIWLKGRPARVYATALTLKTEQHNAVEDDAVVLLEYPDAVAILEPSWNWPYGNGQAEIFGTKGSLTIRGDGLLFQSSKNTSLQNPEGLPIETSPVPPEMRNPIAYFTHCIRTHKTPEGLVEAGLNVGVNEIIDAAIESIRTGRAVSLR